MRLWITRTLLVLLMMASAVASAQTPAAHPLGVNLESVSDWSRSKIFADVMKSARTFGSMNAPGDGTAKTDQNGWPISDFGVIVIADVPHIAGTYKLVFTGQARVLATAPLGKVLNPKYDAATNTTRADVFVGRDATSLFLTFQQTQPTPDAPPGGGVKGIHLWRPDAKEGQTFNTPFLTALEPFSVLRCMDFTATNNNTLIRWEDRPHVTDARQTGPYGVAWEYAIELANTTGKDLWINIPDQADDNYVRQLAKLFKEKLAPGRSLYVEYSNELFNGFTKQHDRNIASAKAEFAAGKWTLPPAANTDPELLGQLRLAKVMVDISQTFRAAYGFAPNDPAFFQKVRPVLCVQMPVPNRLAAMLEFIDKNYHPAGQATAGPTAHLDAVGVGTYPNLWKAPHREMSAVDVLTTLENSVKEIKSQYPPMKVLADKYHLHLLAYEGGPDVQGDQSFNAKLAAQINPRMETLITQLLTDWYAAGGELFCYYNLCGPWGKYGMWGLTEDIERETPKRTALNKIAGKAK